MTTQRGLLAVVLLIAGAVELRAQVIVLSNPYVATSGGGLFYSRSGRHSSFSLAVGTVNVAPLYYAGPYYAAPYAYSGVSRVTVVYGPAPALPAPTLVAAMPRVLHLDDLGVLDPNLRGEFPPDRKAPEPVAPPQGPALPGGRDAGVFKPLAPDNREQANKPVPAEKPKPPPPPPVPPPPELPRAARPDADPKNESKRLIDLGRTAFAAREYGRAAQRFRDAAKQAPDDAMPHFLFAQALFAAGQYAAAVDAIRDGMRLRPDWPTARFPPRDLYGPNAADFAEHLGQLRAALGQSPNDAGLLFLQAYQLWFDGRQDEARPFFQRAGQGSPIRGLWIASWRCGRRCERFPFSREPWASAGVSSARPRLAAKPLRKPCSSSAVKVCRAVSMRDRFSRTSASSCLPASASASSGPTVSARPRS